MRNYVVRRANEEKRYRQVLEEAGLDASERWLRMIAKDQIPSPGVDRMEKLYRHYKLLESNNRRRRK